MTGVVNLLKPPGMTSQNAVTHIKRILGARKAGHAGTLDPGACGVLPVCLGRATRLAPYLADGRKEYIAELTLGTATDSLDSEGRATQTAPLRWCSHRALEDAMASLCGQIFQTPPAYSAVKVQGKPLYAYARAGHAVAAAPRPVEIYSFELLRGAGCGPFLFRICCSKGTYVRVLLADVAKRLGQVGHTSFLMRTQVGRFRAEDAVTFADIESGRAGAHVQSVREAAPGEHIELPDNLYPLLQNGASVPGEKLATLHLAKEALYAVSCSGDFFGMGEYDGCALSLRTRVYDGVQESK